MSQDGIAFPSTTGEALLLVGETLVYLAGERVFGRLATFRTICLPPDERDGLLRADFGGSDGDGANVCGKST